MGFAKAIKRIKSLKEYVIVSQDRIFVEIFRRQRGDKWRWEVFTELKEKFHLDSVNLTLSIADVYRYVKFPARSRSK